MDGNPGPGMPVNGGDQRRRAPSAGSKEKPPDGEAKREDHGVLRADARWVVLLGALSAAVTVLAYVGIQGPVLVHILTRPAASSSSPSPRSPSPGPSATHPASTFPAVLLPALSSSSPAPSSPAQGSGSPAVVPSDFDNVATDPTDISVATMLPEQFNDSGVVFNRTSASTGPCPPVNPNADAGINDTVKDYGCTNEIAGTYLDSFQQIQVAVWVIPLPDEADAEGAKTTLTVPGVTPSGWGIWCPTTGTGSQVCQGEPWQNAAQYAVVYYCHRYLVRALALYVDLAAGTTVLNALDAAARAAVDAIGAQNIGPTAQCAPSTAITAGG